MVKGSEAREYPESVVPHTREVKSQLKVIPGVVKEVEKEIIAKVPDKVQKKIAKKVAVYIVGGIVVSTGGFIALGETGNLPKQVQEWYDETSQPIRKMFGVEEIVIKEEAPAIIVEKPEIVKEEIPPETTIEEEVVEEIINAPEISGLKFDQRTKTYLAEADNPYGLEADAEAGVYVKEAVEVDSGIEDAIGLKPEVIEFIQKKIYEEKKDFVVAIPLNLKDTKGVKISQLKCLQFSNEKQPDILTLGINVPVGSVFYAVYPGEYRFAPMKNFSPVETEDKNLGINIRLGSELALYFADFSDGEILIDVKEKGDYFDKYDFKIGDPMAVILSEKTVDRTANRLHDFNFSYENPGEFQFSLGAYIRNEEGKIRSAEVFALEDIKVFILSSETVHEEAD